MPPEDYYSGGAPVTIVPPPQRAAPRRTLFRLFLAALIVIALGAMIWRGAESNRAAKLAIDELTALAASPNLIDAVLAQNVKTQSLNAAEIAALDAQYVRDHQSGGGMATDLMSRPASRFLADYAAKAPDRIVFIMLMDARGLNVADSRPTTDYMQGDEDKWLKTFPLGAGAVHWGELERDYVTGRLEHVVSRTVVNPKTGEPIGALAIAYDNAALKR